MQKLSHQTHSFDGFTLDLTRGCLLRGIEEVKLRPKAFDVLSYLIENNGRLVSKEELIHAVWVGTAVSAGSATTVGAAISLHVSMRQSLALLMMEVMQTI